MINKLVFLIFVARAACTVVDRDKAKQLVQEKLDSPTYHSNEDWVQIIKRLLESEFKDTNWIVTVANRDEELEKHFDHLSGIGIRAANANTFIFAYLASTGTSEVEKYKTFSLNEETHYKVNGCHTISQHAESMYPETNNVCYYTELNPATSSIENTNSAIVYCCETEKILHCPGTDYSECPDDSRQLMTLISKAAST